MDKHKLEKSLISTLEDFLRKNGRTTLAFEWNDGTKFEAVIDTISETDNGKELYEAGYEDFYACFIIVTRIFSLPKDLSILKTRFDDMLGEGKGCIISYHNAPDKIFYADRILWSMNDF